MQSSTSLSNGEKNLVAQNHILVVEHEEGKKAYLLQRKVGTTAHGSIRVGYVLKDPKAVDEGVWELEEPSSGHPKGDHQHEMVSVIMEEKSKVLSDENGSHGNTSIDPAAELSALQLVATHDPEGVGHVLGTANIACDEQYVYAITDYHREGSLFEYCAEVGYLSEAEARFFFRQIIRVSM
jgi:serine/threonine protein kinase